MTRHAVALSLAALLAGCGDIDRPDPETIGEACIAVAEAACDRLRECYLVESAEIDSCRSAIVQVCCRDAGKCANDPAATGAQLDACLTAWDDHSCSAIVEQRDPAECLVI